MPSRAVFRRTGLIGLAVVALIGSYLGISDASLAFSQNLGNLAILACALFASILCAVAARRRRSRGWLGMSVAMLLCWAGSGFSSLPRRGCR